MLLNKIYKDYSIPSDLYYQLLASIKFETSNDLEDINKFIDELPKWLRLEVTKSIYKNTYEKIDFLSSKPDYFKAWICPLLKPTFFSQD